MNLRGDFYDGRSTKRQPVELKPVPGRVRLIGEGWEREAPLSQVRISERLGDAPRAISFSDGAHLQIRDHAGFESWLAAVGHREERVDLMQRSWTAAVLSLLLLVATIFAGYRWVLPVMAKKVAEHMPHTVVARMSDQVLALLDSQWFEASALSENRQRAIGEKFEVLAGADAAEASVNIVFRRSPKLGANALALPDGRLVLLDELVDLADTDEQIVAVLGHELGHVHYRHNLQALVQGTAVGAVLAWWIGDFSSIIAAAPAAVMQARYSRDLEAEADAYAARLLKEHGQSPELLARMLEKLQAAADAQKHQAQKPSSSSEQRHAGADDAEDDAMNTYLSSHPATRERIHALREAR